MSYASYIKPIARWIFIHGVLHSVTTAEGFELVVAIDVGHASSRALCFRTPSKIWLRYTS